TSHDVVASLRRIFAQRRVGHAGTLDPDATGVLLVGFGKMTRLLRFLSALPKTYVGEMVLGESRDTQDSSGEIVASFDMSGVTLEEVRQGVVGLTGEISQIPPMVSAVKINGVRMYELARKGIEVERPPRKATVSDFIIEDEIEPLVFPFSVTCSAGTYVRTLVNDLGVSLGGGAYLRNLRRVSIGQFDVDRATKVGDLTLGHLISPAQALSFLPSVTPSKSVLDRVTHGAPVAKVELEAVGDGPWAVLAESGNLVAIYEAVGLDKAKPAVVLAS
ncbi:MAG: tRNA pseudouridine(55) synthase TruB, partial [Acidimicrobiales bacterium]|nr:tRNA pseudouridine(55) synthase TruB [Acidimicrobiales bacterium]